MRSYGVAAICRLKMCQVFLSKEPCTLGALLQKRSENASSTQKVVYLLDTGWLRLVGFFKL